jgi:hypothetical protein
MIKYISVHHTGGLGVDNFASTDFLTASDIDKAHAQRWSCFTSSLGHDGGYNFFIEKGGTWTQFRAIGEETAAQRGFNFNTISICLAGNFTRKGNDFVNVPSLEQKQILRFLISTILANNEEIYNRVGIKIARGTEINVSPYAVHPHRWFGNTSCYGNALSDSWARDFALDFAYKNSNVRKMLVGIYTQLLVIFKRRTFGAVSTQCLPERG